MMAASPNADSPEKECPDIRSVAPDLTTPEMTAGEPAPGKRVKCVAPERRDTDVYHALYLPTDWKPGGRYPVIVEYAGNGPYRNAHGDVSLGCPEGSSLGYGISGGKGFIWICMPCVDPQNQRNARMWFGDISSTVEYARKTVRRVCEEYGGDPGAVIVTGFSRGALACWRVGLHSDEIADVWLAFIPYGECDGVRVAMPWPGCDRPSALARLARLKGRASFVCQEATAGKTFDLAATRRYLGETGIVAPFTFQEIAFRNHNDQWTLRDIPERRALRAWLEGVLEERPGTHSIRGRVVDREGRPLAGVRVRSGYTHWADTGPDGRYEIRGIIDGGRAVMPEKIGCAFTPAEREATLKGEDVNGVDFEAAAPPPPPKRSHDATQSR